MEILKPSPENRQLGAHLGGWPGFTKPNLPATSHPLEIFGSVFEDNPDKILLWGHSNLNSAIKYLLFVIL